MALKNYHLVWLAAHPSRTEAWLQEKLKEGFDIHHLDGNHKNDAPENLVLMEHIDHMRLHGKPARFNRLAAAKGYKAYIERQGHKLPKPEPEDKTNPHKKGGRLGCGMFR